MLERIFELICVTKTSWKKKKRNNIISKWAVFNPHVDGRLRSIINFFKYLRADYSLEKNLIKIFEVHLKTKGDAEAYL